MMRKYRFSFLNFFFGVLILSATVNAGFSQDSLTIDGTITNLEVSQIQLLQLVPNQVIASATVNNDGEFRLAGIIPDETIYQLNLTEGKYLMLILKPGENVSIQIDGNTISFPDIKGSEQSEKLYQTIKKYHQYEMKIEEYRNQMLSEQDAFIKDFLANDTTLATLFFGDRVPIESNLETYKQTISNLKDKYSDNYFVNDLEKRINSFSKLAVDTQMPDIALPNPQGDTLKLSDYKGNVVLVDFWASWCGPCRQSNPHLVELYDKYKDRGFEIFGVSLDRTREAWVNGIENDSLSWPQVSDLNYWSSSVVKDFGISGIPFTVLIDEQGKILAKGLRGKALEDALADIFPETEN